MQASLYTPFRRASRRRSLVQPNRFNEHRRPNMATSRTPVHLCWICGNDVPLEKSKIDEHGLAVHQECYIRRLLPKKTPPLRSEEALHHRESGALARKRFRSPWGSRHSNEQTDNAENNKRGGPADFKPKQDATAFSALDKELNRLLDGNDPLRCPCCVEDGNFRLMVLHVDGRYICAQCGHIRTP